MQFKVDDKVWFTRSPMGKIRGEVQFGIPALKLRILDFHTNHSLRATTCSLVLGKGAPKKLIMDRTGQSLHAYQRETSREREAVSDVLQGSKSSFLEGSPPQKILKARAKGRLNMFVRNIYQGYMTRGI